MTSGPDCQTGGRWVASHIKPLSPPYTQHTYVPRHTPSRISSFLPFFSVYDLRLGLVLSLLRNILHLDGVLLLALLRRFVCVIVLSIYYIYFRSFLPGLWFLLDFDYCLLIRALRSFVWPLFLLIRGSLVDNGGDLALDRYQGRILSFFLILLESL